MIIFLKTGGEVAYVSDENIHLGSDKANSLFVVAPYAPASSVCVAFKLPNGKTLGPGFVENQGVVTFDSEDGVYAMQKVTFEGDSSVIPDTPLRDSNYPLGATIFRVRLPALAVLLEFSCLYSQMDAASPRI